MLIAIVLGILTWSFLEYVIHRFLGHHRTWARKNPFGIEHTAHHSRGNYFAPAWKKGLAAGLFLAILLPPAWLLAGSYGLAYVIGFTAFYLSYEVLHRLMHVWAGVGPYGRWARRHHFFHHFHDPKKNHGVTSPIWDLVFGTYVRPEKIVVPEKLAMPWLFATDQTLRPELDRDYALRLTRASPRA
ncbi:MAG: sterol desaturase family protein [Deltaproteobacteria bacterium]|jgi:sterol desaturase/sphingolipid hydroxylase (fatty acid hydroxylase superfamily)|nr:sterol desaturase family protein [Deltaproteobacteria bacterium]